jgi:hypothetical protein
MTKKEARTRPRLLLIHDSSYGQMLATIRSCRVVSAFSLQSA